MRSQFNFEQFEIVLQKIAHDAAIKAVQQPESNIRITTKSNRKFDTVETNDFTIRFYANHISYNEGSWHKGIKWGFDVEEKLYTSSNHSTKISYYAQEGKDKEVTEQVTKFIDKIMNEARMQPVPRFSLQSKNT